VTMKSLAAVCYGVGEDWRVQEIEIDELGPSDVHVHLAFAGLCHSDEHVRVGDFAATEDALASLGVSSMFPVVGGHEGAGVVRKVGSRVSTVAPGDHVAVSFVPACGTCFYCASGRSNLCDATAATLAGPMITDGVWRHHVDGANLNRMSQVGTFCEQLVCSERSLIKIPTDVPLDVAAIVSCGVATGFGSSVRRGDVRPGQVVVVVGCGGVGHGALLGAVSAGARAIVAVDPVGYKREMAQRFGATHVADSMTEALPVVAEITAGRMADVAVLTPGLLRGGMLIEALPLVCKDGRVVCTAVQRWDEIDAQVSLYELAMYNKAILGSLFGSTGPREQIPAILDLYRAGRLPLDDLVTERYALADVNKGYADMNAGRIVRGVIAFG